jgi:CHASE2 domain-containing sensor protein
VKSAVAAEPDVRRSGRIRLVGIAVLVTLAALIGREAALTANLRSAWFDAFQLLAPRIPRSMPVTVVEIDQKSLARIGQWPASDDGRAGGRHQRARRRRRSTS